MIPSDIPLEELMPQMDLSQFSSVAAQTVITPDFLITILTPFFKKYWRYDSISKQWYNFDNKVWKPEDSVLTDIIQANLNLRPKLTPWNPPQVDKMHLPAFANQMKDRMQQSGKLIIKPDQWDQHLELLNTPVGIAHLPTGLISPHDGEKLLTNMSGFEPLDDEDGRKCPNYMQHLNFVSGGDAQFLKYLEELSGYFLTGYTWLQDFYVWYGHGANGKSVLAGIWRRCMGDYCAMANSGQFTAAGGAAHKEQDARLMNKRLVISEEIAGGSYADRWDLNKIKDWTSGNTPITARQMYGKSFEYIPQFKLLFIGNQKPSLASTDYAMERRLRLMLFENRVPADKRDLLFLEKLSNEGPYILSRMIKAARSVIQAKNVSVPDSITAASRSYLQSENVVAMFIEDSCDIAEYEHITFVEFYDALEKWGTREGVDIPSKKSVTKTVESMGYIKGGGKNMRTVSGIKLKAVSTKGVIVGDKYYDN